MSTKDILKPLNKLDLKKLTREELEELFLGEQNLRLQKEEEKLLLEERYVLIKSKIFSPSSEKTLPKEINKPNKKNKKKRESYSKSLTERYPNVEVKEEEISLEKNPQCSCCESLMEDSGLTEDSEYLTIIPKKYLIVRQKRVKYRCQKCHSSIVLAPGRARIAPGSSYGDELILDATLSKYCDLIPMERYAMMAARMGVMDLPPHSLIGLSHFLADFFNRTYELLKNEVQSSRIIQADETPHKMLEGADKKNWYLWAFVGSKTCYFELRDSRSGEVTSNFLKDSNCKVLVSDVYAGYARAVNESNQYRLEIGGDKIISSYCNAHARRKFKEAEHPFASQASYYLKHYQEIYRLESESKKLTDKSIAREQMRILFEEMRAQGPIDLSTVSSRSSLATAINYFIKNYAGLTYPLADFEVPLDNNASERVIRNPVIGRKTWYGTHSTRGAQTASIIFSLVESCKLNGVNPRAYFKDLVESIHQSHQHFTPSQYLKRQKNPD